MCFFLILEGETNYWSVVVTNIKFICFLRVTVKKTAWVFFIKRGSISWRTLLKNDHKEPYKIDYLCHLQVQVWLAKLQRAMKTEYKSQIKMECQTPKQLAKNFCMEKLEFLQKLDILCFLHFLVRPNRQIQRIVQRFLVFCTVSLLMSFPHVLRKHNKWCRKNVEKNDE